MRRPLSRTRVALGLFVLVSSAPLALYACGGGDDSSLPDTGFPDASTTYDASSHPDAGHADGGSTSNATAETACAAIYGEQMKAFASCCTADELKVEPGQSWHSLAQFYDYLCQATLGSSLDAGRSSIDEAKLASCLAGNQARFAPPAGCNYALDTSGETYAITDPEPVADCQQVIVGNGAVGAPCATQTECKAGLTCFNNRGVLTDAGIVFKDGTCQNPAQNGMPCGPAEADGGHKDLEIAADPTHPQCASGFCGFGTCMARGTTGAPCASDNFCSTGLHCHNGACGAAGRSDVNGDCKDGRHDCKIGLRCVHADGGPVGTCQAKLAAGATCIGEDINSDYNDCKGTCVAEAGAPGKCASYCSSQ